MGRAVRLMSQRPPRSLHINQREIRAVFRRGVRVHCLRERPSNMIDILPAAEADLPRIIDIQGASFAPNPWSQVMFPRGYDEECKAKMVEEGRGNFQDPTTVYMKAIDTESGEIISFARWHVYKQARPRSEWDTPAKPEYLGPNVNSEAYNEFMRLVHERRKQHLGGKPHCSKSDQVGCRMTASAHD
jgi:hypothetical protein